MTPTVTVCGLGPGGHDHVTAATLAAIERSSVRLLRTGRHPTADLVPDARTFDDVYETADTFDEVYATIADAVVAEALAGPFDGGVLYAVPGSPLVLESTVQRLRADDRVEVELVPALSFLDLAWARLGVDPIDDGVRLVDGHRFAVEAAGERGPLLVAHTHGSHILSDVKLAIDAGPEQTVVVLQRLGTPDEAIFEVPWPDLDRVVEPDHLTSLYLPEVAAPVARELAATVELMHRLRQECPWDREQTHESLRPFLLEEAYEVLDALDAGPSFEDLEEELGDLWFQILFHAELAAEAGEFSIADVARTVHEKLVRRHPHVFTELQVDGADEVVANWDQIKRTEKQRTSALDGIPRAQPALLLAAKTLSRAARAGKPIEVDTDAGPSADLGFRLLALVAEAHHAGIDPELALRATVDEIATRYRQTEI